MNITSKLGICNLNDTNSCGIYGTCTQIGDISKCVCEFVYDAETNCKEIYLKKLGGADVIISSIALCWYIIVLVLQIMEIKLDIQFKRTKIGIKSPMFLTKINLLFTILFEIIRASIRVYEGSNLTSILAVYMRIFIALSTLSLVTNYTLVIASWITLLNKVKNLGEKIGKWSYVKYGSWVFICIINPLFFILLLCVAFGIGGQPISSVMIMVGTLQSISVTIIPLCLLIPALKWLYQFDTNSRKVKSAIRKTYSLLVINIMYFLTLIIVVHNIVDPIGSYGAHYRFVWTHIVNDFIVSTIIIGSFFIFGENYFINSFRKKEDGYKEVWNKTNLSDSITTPGNSSNKKSSNNDITTPTTISMNKHSNTHSNIKSTSTFAISSNSNDSLFNSRIVKSSDSITTSSNDNENKDSNSKIDN